MKKYTSKPFILFLPFLLLYTCIILIGHKDEMVGDEARYYMYATNLLHGFYSPKNEVFLWNGPGYPLLLAPFIALGLPTIFLTLLNALFQYLSVVYLYKALSLFVGIRNAIIFSIIWACYYIAYKELSILYTESLANMLVSCLIFYISKAFLDNNRQFKNILKSGLLFAFLALTKIIFGYVILVLLGGFLLLFLFKRSTNLKKAILIACIALIGNLPYLFYTWNLTGKPMYWANSGGTTLYWASTPIEGEFGDWNDDHFTAYCGYDENMPCNASLFAIHHQKDYDYIYQFKGIERDEAFKKKAIENIRNYPFKYIKNCLANISRLFFGLPFSYSYFRFQNILKIPPGAVVFLMLIFSSILTIINFKKMPFVFYLIMAILLTYLGGSIMISTYQRLLSVAVPLIVFWTAYLFDRSITIKKIQ